MDTGALFVEIKTKGIYNDDKSMINEFDTSDYPEDNVCGVPLVNIKLFGIFRDEVNGQIMKERTGLRSKLYT